MFTQTNEETAWRLVARQRSGLCGFLESLDQDEWNTQSLCDGWRVRDVLAHLLLEYHYDRSNSWKDFMRSGFRLNRFMEQTAVKLGQWPTHELTDDFRAMIGERRKPAAISVLNVLADLLVHEQDIRTPLGYPQAMPIDSLRLIFAHWEPADFNLGEKLTGVAGRVKGLSFEIEDIGSTKSVGLPVRGNAQNILLAVTGRRIGMAGLHGAGATVLSNRLK